MKFNIKNKVMETLKNLQVPTYYATNHNATEKEYMVYFIDEIKTNSNSDNEAESIRYSISLYFYSTADYDDLVEEALEVLKANNFRRTVETEYYDSDTDFYIKVIRLNYIQYL